MNIKNVYTKFFILSDKMMVPIIDYLKLK